MALAAVRFRDDGYHLEILGVGIVANNEWGDGFLGSREVVAGAGLTSLQHALGRYAKDSEPPYREGVNPRTGARVKIPFEGEWDRALLQVVDVPAEKLEQHHSYEFLPEPVALVLRADRLLLRVSFVASGDEEPEKFAWRDALAPLLTRHRAELVSLDAQPEGAYSYRGKPTIASPDFWDVSLYLSMPIRGKSVQDALNLGGEVYAFASAAEGGGLTQASTLALLEAGRAHLLLGLSESAWLECKRQPYGDDERGKYELAKDVSAFANSESGGLIVIGLETKPTGGRDVIHRIRPLPREHRLAHRYRAWAADRIYPRPTGLELLVVDCSEESVLVVIVIPSQPVVLKPFLVRGRMEDGRTRGTYVAIFGRRDDRTAVMSAEEIHALLVAGRGALGYESL